jgi:hypothetical protein
MLLSSVVCLLLSAVIYVLWPAVVVVCRDVTKDWRLVMFVDLLALDVCRLLTFVCRVPTMADPLLVAVVWRFPTFVSVVVIRVSMLVKLFPTLVEVNGTCQR